MAAFPLGPSSDVGVLLAPGMEQFHHPRAVRVKEGSLMRPTPQRRQLLSGVAGRMAEFGAGDGIKLTCYPAEVEEVVLIDSDHFLRETVRAVAEGLPFAVRLIDGEPTRVPAAPDQAFDAVVCSLILCCAPRLDIALAEVRRILRPGGELRFYEHARSAHPVLRLAEGLLTPIWAQACGGCHPARDPVAAITAAGFTIERLERLTISHVSHVVGLARLR